MSRVRGGSRICNCLFGRRGRFCYGAFCCSCASRWTACRTAFRLNYSNSGCKTGWATHTSRFTNGVRGLFRRRNRTGRKTCLFSFLSRRKCRLPSCSSDGFSFFRPALTRRSLRFRQKAMFPADFKFESLPEKHEFCDL